MTEISSTSSLSRVAARPPSPADRSKEDLGFWGKIAFVRFGWGMGRKTPADVAVGRPGHLAPARQSSGEEVGSDVEEVLPGGEEADEPVGDVRRLDHWDDRSEPRAAGARAETRPLVESRTRFEGTRATLMSTLASVATFVEEFGHFCYQEMVEDSEVFQTIYHGMRWVVIESSSLLHGVAAGVPDLKDSARMVYQRLDPDELAEESAEAENPQIRLEPIETKGMARGLAGHLTQEVGKAFLSSGDAEEVLFGCAGRARELLEPLSASKEIQTLLDECDDLCVELREASEDDIQIEDFREGVEDCLKRLAATLPADRGHKALRKSFESFSLRVTQAFTDCAERRATQGRFEMLFGSELKKVVNQLERNPLAGPLLRDPAFLKGIQDEVTALTTVVFDRVNADSVQSIRERCLRTGANCLGEYCSLLDGADGSVTRGDLLRQLEQKQLTAETDYRRRAAFGEVNQLRFEHYLSPGILLRSRESEGEPSEEEQRAHEVKFLTGLFLDVIEGVVEERRDSFVAPEFVYHAIAEQMAVRASELLDQLSDHKRIDLAFYRATHMVQDIIGPKAFYEKVRELTPSFSQIPGMLWSFMRGEKEEWEGPNFVSEEEAKALVIMLKTATLKVATLPDSVRGHFETFNLEGAGAPKKLQDLIDQKMAEWFIINDENQQVLRADTFNQILDLVLQHILEVGDQSTEAEAVLFPEGADDFEEEMAIFFGDRRHRPRRIGYGVPDGRLWDHWKCWPGLEDRFGAWSALKRVRSSLRQHPDLARNLVLIELEGVLRETFPHRRRGPLEVGGMLPRKYHRSEPEPEPELESDETSDADSSATEPEAPGGGRVMVGAAKALRVGLEIKDFVGGELGESRVMQAGKHGLRAVLEEFNDPFGMSRVLAADGDTVEEIEESEAQQVLQPRIFPQGFDNDRAYYADLCRRELGPYLAGGLGITTESAKELGQSDSLDVFYDSLGRMVVDLREALLDQLSVSDRVVDAAEQEAIEIVKLALQRFDAEAVQELREESIVRISKFMKIAIDLQAQLTEDERDSRSKRQKVFLQHLRHEGLLSDAISIGTDEVGQRKKEQDHYAGAIQNLVEEIAAQRGYRVPGFVVQGGSRVVAARMSEILDFVTTKETLDFSLGHLVDQIQLKFDGQTLSGYAVQTVRSGVSDILRGKKTELPDPRPVLSDRERDALVDILSSLFAVSGRAPVASSLVRHQRKRVADVVNYGFEELLPSLSTVTRMLSDGTLERVPVCLDDFFAGEKPPEDAAPCWKGLESFSSLYSILRDLRTFWIENPRVTRAAVCTTIDGAISKWNDRNDEMLTGAS